MLPAKTVPVTDAPDVFELLARKLLNFSDSNALDASDATLLSSEPKRERTTSLAPGSGTPPTRTMASASAVADCSMLTSANWLVLACPRCFACCRIASLSTTDFVAACRYVGVGPTRYPCNSSSASTFNLSRPSCSERASSESALSNTPIAPAVGAACELDVILCA